jgi:hypothetical protein
MQFSLLWTDILGHRWLGRGPAEPRLEVVGRQLQPMMEAYFTTGSVA